MCFLPEVTEEAVSETVVVQEEEEAVSETLVVEEQQVSTETQAVFETPKEEETMQVEKVTEAVITRVVTETHGGVVAVVLSPQELSNRDRKELKKLNRLPVKVESCSLVMFPISSNLISKM